MYFGRDLRIFFLRPLLEAGGGGGRVEAAPPPSPARWRSQAQRATATRPRTQIKAQRRAARIMTKSESYLSGSAVSEMAEELTPARYLKGRI